VVDFSVPRYYFHSIKRTKGFFMKNNIIYFFVLCVLMISNAVSQEYQEESVCSIRCENYNYLKLGAGYFADGMGPVIGLGRRFAFEEAAIDISFNWMGRDKAYYFSSPKMLYLYYLTPFNPSSFYLGGGLGLGAIRGKHDKFSGLLAEASVGYEMRRNTLLRLFAEINFSHGLIPFHSKYKVRGFSPAISFSAGAGF
jgi:hypothetical protein